MTLTATYLYLAPQLPRASQLRTVDYQIPLRIFSRDGELIGEFGEKRRTPLHFEQFPPEFVSAVLAAEDERFYRHGGVDLKGLFRAALELVWYRDIRSGGSTITMQVARNFFLDREQKFLRKFNEIVLAIEIENILSKEEILELYLNKIYLGHRAYGAEAAAQVYYGKPLSELHLEQWAMIAGLPKAPSAYNPITNPQRAMTRRNWILGRMLHLGNITQAEYDQAVGQPVTASYHGPSPDVEAAYVAEMVRRDLLRDYDAEQVYNSGMRVFVTLDSKLQRDAVNALRDGLHEYDERHGWRGAEAHIDLPDAVVEEVKQQAAQASADQATAASGTEVSATGQTATVTAGADTADQTADPLAPLLEQVGARGTVGKLAPALVLAVQNQSATLALEDGTRVELPWEQMNWAKRYKSVEYIGDEPKTAAEIMSPGDIVRLRPVTDDQGNAAWRLAQVPQVESAMVSLDPQTGAVRALVGGYSFSQSHFNRAIQGQRQAGSSFKPFIYSSGLLHGMTPATLINDAPVVFQDSELETAWRPTGAGSHFYGPTRLREALYRSLNLVSIRLLQQVTIPEAVKVLKRFGLPTERFPHDLSLALGSAAVSPMELATGYCIFANGGFRVEPWYIDHIEDRDGNIMWQAPRVELCDKCAESVQADSNGDVEAATENNDADTDTGAASDSNDAASTDDDGREVVKRYRIMDPRVIWLMDSMMKDVVKRGTARRAMALGRNDLAGKTGTTNDQVDAWFSGYAPGLVATVWVGFDNPSTLGRGEYGGRAALPIWMEYMGKALAGVPEQFPPQPAGIVTARIDAKTGKRARPGDRDAIFEYFRKENLPETDASPANEDSTSTSPEQLF